MELNPSTSSYLKFKEMHDKSPLTEEELLELLIAHGYAHFKGGEML